MLDNDQQRDDADERDNAATNERERLHASFDATDDALTFSDDDGPIHDETDQGERDDY